MAGAAGAVGRAEPLRHDALAAELAGLPVDDGAVADNRLRARGEGIIGRAAQAGATNGTLATYPPHKLGGAGAASPKAKITKNLDGHYSSI